MVAAIGRRRLLLVCDGIEHLLAGPSSFGHLPERCPSLTLLATSRERVHLEGERVFDGPAVRRLLLVAEARLCRCRGG
jgi:predicted ATPase